jgi:nucleoside-diphosphate-sugar epimerase
MKVAIFGATSTIARDLVKSMLNKNQHELLLYSRRPIDVQSWLCQVGYNGRVLNQTYDLYGEVDHDAVINFVGVGAPSKAGQMGGSILEITQEFDGIILEQLRKNPSRRYIFLSSGAAYGSNFLQPVDSGSNSITTINDIRPEQFYTIAKLHAEARHRSSRDLHIFDLRIFNYLSESVNLDARFLITDLIRAVKDNKSFCTTLDEMYRDFMHPTDFEHLIDRILYSKGANVALDCYSKSPISKEEIIQIFQKRYGLKVSYSQKRNAIAATGEKKNYYSKNRLAADFGYVPKYSSRTALDDILPRVLP